MNDIDMLYERFTRHAEERRVPDDQHHSVSPSLHSNPSSTTSTTTIVPANQCQDLPLLLEHAQWAVAPSTTLAIILAFSLQLVALWIRARFTRTWSTEWDNARSVSSESPATSSSTSPMQHEGALPLVQEWRALLSSARPRTLSIMQVPLRESESAAHIPFVPPHSVLSTAPSDLSAGRVLYAERIRIEHAVPRLVADHRVPGSEDSSDDDTCSAGERSFRTPARWRHNGIVSIPIPSPVVINAANAAQARRNPMQGPSHYTQALDVAEEVGQESVSRHELAPRSDASSPISNLGILHDDDESREELQIAMPRPRHIWSIQALEGLIPRLRAFYPTPTQSSSRGDTSARIVPTEAASADTREVPRTQSVRSRRCLRHSLRSESLHYLYRQNETLRSLNRQGNGDGDDDWPWYPTGGASSRPSQWNTTFAFPRKETYPIIQRVRFSRGHGLINVTAIREEKKKARRAALRRRIHTLLSLTIEWN